MSTPFQSDAFLPARSLARRLPLLLLAGVWAACSGGDTGTTATPPSATAPEATFARIQREILDKQCTSCHKTGTSDARQSRLVLTGDSAYLQLVGVAATQLVAKADGLLRVKAFRADSSLLYHKVSLVPGHHSRDYGLLMPMTTQGLTAGQLEYLRRWIEAGAPRTGVVVDTQVLADARPQTAAFSKLDAPATGTGVQLVVDSFAVSPQMEREFFVYRTLKNPTELYVNRFQARMRPGSHHLLLYVFDESRTTGPCATRPQPDLVRDIRNRDGTLNLVNMLPMACHVYFAGSMNTDFEYRFPPGVALRLPPNAALDFNLHYVNRAPIDLPGQAFANLYTVPASEVRRVAQPLNLANASFSLPPQKRTTIRTVFPMTRQTTVLGLTSHMHALGERFEILVRRANGTETSVYVNTDWEHPAFLNLATPLVLEAGDSLVSVVTWNNVTDRTVSFGLLSSDEMDIIFGYAY